jgi:heterodisulfide reductase subunit C
MCVVHGPRVRQEVRAGAGQRWGCMGCYGCVGPCSARWQTIALALMIASTMRQRAGLERDTDEDHGGGANKQGSTSQPA